MPIALHTRSLTKRFARHIAVDDVSMAVPTQAIYGFLGANGAGKTTTLRLALGLLRADSGWVELFGRRVGRDTLPRVGALIENPSLYPHLTGRENLDITRRLLGLDHGEIDRVLAIVDLASAERQRVGGYSLGMRQRLAIARALLGRPQLLILDEPTNGLDPEGIVDMRSLIRRLPATDGATLIVSSHHLAEIEQVATHVGLIHHGRLLLEQPLDVLLGQQTAVEIATDDLVASAELLDRAGYAVAYDLSGRLLLVTASPDQPTASAPIAALLVGERQVLHHLALRRPTLEHTYHRAIAAA
ncbi:MAG: ATP-binding cassette domain-containing protein [Sphingomonas sp.]|uniref:ATP-binding cassette domain-containing protein n=1 Tax=Sphingomonas sp. TaxID=28214 RepID=UPI0035A85062|nr:ATP-binding cassette domain-containing protein [Sphingomonas sp.]